MSSIQKHRFMLEVQKYIGDAEYNKNHLEEESIGGRYIHVGYMNILFSTREIANEYFAKHHQGKRLVPEETGGYYGYVKTGYRYVLREFLDEVLNIPPFDPNDACVYEICRNEDGKIVQTSWSMYAPTL